MKKREFSLLLLFFLLMLSINGLIINAAYTTIMSFFSQIALSSGYLKIISNLFSMILATLVIFTAIVILLERRDPAKTLAWLLILIFLPIVGFILYLVFGRQFRKRRMTAKKKVLNNSIYPLNTAFAEGKTELTWMTKTKERLINLISNNAEFPATLHNDAKILQDGEQTFAAFCEAIKSAQEYIYLETYILRDDHIGGKISGLLKAKAEKGVKVRVIFDAIGSKDLSADYLAGMRAAGVLIEPFFPVRMSILQNKINYRNHRKILVVDGTIGFVGGINIGDEYLGRDPAIGYWRDNHLRIRGNAVYFLQRIFLQDWYFMTKESLEHSFLRLSAVENGPGDKVVQITASGPDTHWETIMQVYYYAIATAQESIYMASPYFVPNESILTALQTAALSGIDVKILLPAKSDHPLVELAACSYLEELMETGVEIYLYKQGFLHSKLLMIDGVISSVGSANMDQRSFNLNFEVNALIYDNKTTQQLEKSFFEDLQFSEKLDLESFKDRSFRRQLLESGARLLSPLL